jgi:hypothetical protein
MERVCHGLQYGNQLVFWKPVKPVQFYHFIENRSVYLFFENLEHFEKMKIKKTDRFIIFYLKFES